MQNSKTAIEIMDTQKEEIINRYGQVLGDLEQFRPLFAPPIIPVLLPFSDFHFSIPSFLAQSNLCEYDSENSKCPVIP